MAIIPLTSPQSCVNFFHESVLLYLRHWQDCQAIKKMDVQALDRERLGFIRTICFAFDIPEVWSEVRELILLLTPYMERRGYWETWCRILDRAVAVADDAGDVAGSVELSLLLARLLQRQSDFEAAIARYRQTIRLAHQIGDRYNKARACSNLGFLYSEQGYWWRAEILCCYALIAFEELDSFHGRAHTENHLGILYIWQCRWELARQHLKQACELWQMIGDNYGLLSGFINLGSLYDDVKCPDQALFYLEKALDLAKLTGEEAQLANIFMNMSIAYRLKGRLDQAEAYIWQAEILFRNFANLVGLAQVQDNLGLIYLDQRKWSQSKLYFKAALQAWRELGNDYGAIRTLTYIIEYELAKGCRLEAEKQFEKVVHLINLSSQNRQTPYWQSLLDKCRRSLDEYSPKLRQVG